MPALQGVMPICRCPPLSWGAPYSLWLGQPFGPLTSPLHVQMALHCIRSSLSTNASRSSCCSLASPGSGFVLSTFAIISFDSPHSAVRPLSPVFQGRKSRLRASVGPRVPQLQATCLVPSSFLRSTGFHPDFITGLGIPGGEMVRLVKDRRGGTVFVLTLPFPCWVKTWLLCSVMFMYLK